jgi:hypothetical protein
MKTPHTLERVGVEIGLDHSPFSERECLAIHRHKPLPDFMPVVISLAIERVHAVGRNSYEFRYGVILLAA